MISQDEKRLALPLSSEPGQRFGMVFFEPQTGRYERKDWESNFYHYRLRNSVSGRFTVDWLEENIAKAEIGTNGLMYSVDFYAELDAAERHADKTIQRVMKLIPDCIGGIPQKVK